jgi:hypothetical protein
MPQLSRNTMEEVLTANRFLTLPRLSSQRKFEEICPEERKAIRKRFLFNFDVYVDLSPV